MVAVANICMTPTSLKTAVDIKTKWRICFSVFAQVGLLQFLLLVLPELITNKLITNKLPSLLSQ